MKIEGCILRINNHSSGVEVFIINEKESINTSLHLPPGMSVDPNESLEFIPAPLAETETKPE